jgi:hypothetical protein
MMHFINAPERKICPFLRIMDATLCILCVFGIPPRIGALTGFYQPNIRMEEEE